MNSQPPHKDPQDGSAPQPGGGRPVPLDRIEEALRGLRYGSVLAIVQDGVVVQIERTEKTRFSHGDQR